VVEPAKLLVIDDEQPMLRAVSIGLEARGYRVLTALTGADGVSRAALDGPDVIILDLTLPDMDGLEVCRRIRGWTETPIVVLSAHAAEARKVEVLDAGADDYVTKPFGMAELEARLRVALRHGSRLTAESEGDAVVTVGPLGIDLARRTVTVHDREVNLTAREFDLLAFLARHPGRVVTHRMLLEEVWGPGYGTETHYLRVHTSHIRKKIEDDPSRPRLLITRSGVGYQLVDPG
jgi:two-component system, OmpR family, KDP operon response regulator KdpE